MAVWLTFCGILQYVYVHIQHCKFGMDIAFHCLMPNWKGLIFVGNVRRITSLVLNPTGNLDLNQIDSFILVCGIRYLVTLKLTFPVFSDKNVLFVREICKL